MKNLPQFIETTTAIRKEHQQASMTSQKELSIESFCAALAAKHPTPGGGGAAAIGAAVGAAAASMSAAYTQRKKDEASGAAEEARKLQSQLELLPLLNGADDDAKAYSDLQATWKSDHGGFSAEELEAILARALEVPTNLVAKCHEHIVAIQAFLEHCNPSISSDAKVGIHLLAGAARAAYQTALVNKPSAEEKNRLRDLLREIQQIESNLLKLEDEE
jgi:formiminotetrahydrofolate cyclodeaminase